MRVRADIDDREVLSELSTKDLSDELERRQKVQPVERAVISLTRVYEEFVRRGDAPQCLKDYIYQEIGRIL